jgi:hypothetical protein
MTPPVSFFVCDFHFILHVLKVFLLVYILQVKTIIEVLGLQKKWK